jgi:hypothetical protein
MVHLRIPSELIDTTYNGWSELTISLICAISSVTVVIMIVDRVD